jgi:hypothetical protein
MRLDGGVLQLTGNLSGRRRRLLKASPMQLATACSPTDLRRVGDERSSRGCAIWGPTAWRAATPYPARGFLITTCISGLLAWLLIVGGSAPYLAPMAIEKAK